MSQASSSHVNRPRKALFLDRDGVAIDYIPYLNKPEQVAIPNGAGEALQQWQQAGYLLIIATNQSGVGRGYFSLVDVEAVHERMRAEYASFGVSFTDILVCPHHPDIGCDCRKPSPQMLYLAAQKHGIDLAQSYFLGDTLGDLYCALRAGCQPLLVLTGLGRETYARLSELPESIPYFERVADTVSIWGEKGIASRDLV